MPPRVGHRLERHRSHRRMSQSELDDVAQLMLIKAALDRCRERHGEPGPGAVVQRPALDRPQVPSTDLPVGALVKAVELQVNVDRLTVAAVALAERGGAPLVPAPPNAL